MAETIQYSQAGREDIRFGRSTFEVTLANGATVNINELDLGYVLAALTGLKTYAATTDLPAVDAAYPGRLARVTADGKLYVDNGTAWVAWAIPGGTTGSIPFYTSTGLAQNNANLFWDNTNNRLGIGTATNLNELINIANNKYLAGVNAAGNATKKIIGFNSSDQVVISESGTSVLVNGAATFNQNATIVTGRTLTITDATQNALAYGGASGLISFTNALQNGFVPIGTTNGAPTAAALTAGTGIAIANGPGSITISRTALLAYNESGVQTSITNTAVETNLCSFTVKGSDLGTNGVVSLYLGLLYLNNSGANRTATIKIKFGGTTLYSDTTGAIAASANNRTARLRIDLQNSNSATAQTMTGSFTLSSASAAATGIGDLSTTDSISSSIGGSSSENTASDLTFTVTWTHGSAAANLTVTVREFYALVI